MNFMLRPENAAQNAEYIGLFHTNKAKNYYQKKLPKIKQFYPDDETIKHLEVYQDLGQEYLEFITICSWSLRCIGNKKYLRNFRIALKS